MLSKRVGNLKISQSQHEGKPLLILEGCCDKCSSESLYKILIQFLKNGHKVIAIDTKNLQHVDIKCNMAISTAHREFVKVGGKIKIISHSEPVSKAMKIMRKNHLASHDL
jgi:anti-anti-sigma regulatory factor